MTRNGRPPRVYISYGRYYFQEDLAERNPHTGRPKQKAHPLSRVSEGEAAMLRALADLPDHLNAGRRPGSMVALVDAWLARRACARTWQICPQDPDRIPPHGRAHPHGVLRLQRG